MSAKEFTCLLVGETSQGRGSSEPEEALIPLVYDKNMILTCALKLYSLLN